MIDSFPNEIHEAIGYYVYRLIDPRDGSTFYVGKGKGNRVFEHMKGAVSLEIADDDDGVDSESLKERVIREILNEGFQPIHVIHRHGLATSEEALLAEAVLIDAIPGLTNIVGGHGSGDFGPCNAKQILMRYQMEVADVPKGLKVLTININRSATENISIYEAVRCAWRINVRRAVEADVVLAVSQGVCKGVFEADRWLPATRENFAQLAQDIPGRSGFEGRVARQRYQEIFLQKKLPSEFDRKKGMASPIQYNYD